MLGRQPLIGSVTEAKNGREAIALIRDQRPDLVLLDVQMPRVDGFAVVQAVGAECMPAVIFVTAHDQYAIRAFEIAAVDYLLKPVSDERFSQRVPARGQSAAGCATRGGYATGAGHARRDGEPAAPARALCGRLGERTLFVPVQDVDRIEALRTTSGCTSGRRPICCTCR